MTYEEVRHIFSQSENFWTRLGCPRLYLLFSGYSEHVWHFLLSGMDLFLRRRRIREGKGEKFIRSATECRWIKSLPRTWIVWGKESNLLGDFFYCVFLMPEICSAKWLVERLHELGTAKCYRWTEKVGFLTDWGFYAHFTLSN